MKMQKNEQEKSQQISFEESLIRLKENRAKLAQSDSFDEITMLWKKIQEDSTNCTYVLNEITKEVAHLDQISNINDVQNKELSIKFSEALKRIEILCDEIKNAPISRLPNFIKEMHELKNFCFKKLDEEKVKMEEIV